MKGASSLLMLGILLAVFECTTFASSSPPLQDSSACQANGTARVVDTNARLAVGATRIDISTVNVDLLSPRTGIEFNPPFDPPAIMSSGSCSCSTALGMQCQATFLFVSEPLPESLVGHNITARLAVNDTYVTNWTRVATIMPAPVLTASNSTQVTQYVSTFTVHGRYLGLPATGASGRENLRLFFKDANGTAVDAQVVAVNSDATSASVSFTGGGPRALGPLQASAELWGVRTDYVQVATVIKVQPDATSALICGGSTKALSVKVSSQLSCVINVQGNRHPLAGSLGDFSIFLGPGSHGLLGNASLSLDHYRVIFTYTAPASPGFDQLHVTFNVSTEISGSPFNITIWEDKSNDGDKVPWRIIIPVAACGGGVLVLVIIATALWVRWRRRSHYEIIDEYH